MIDRRMMIAGGAAAVVATGAWVLLRPEADTGLLPGAAQAQEAGETVEIPDMVLGNAEAAVEVIEYASFTCPHCANFHSAQFQQLKANYIDPGLIRFVYREVYFDRPGLWASMAARCGNEQQFFAIVEMLYAQQGEWARMSDPNAMVDQFKRIGRTAGLTDEALNACLQDATLAQSLVGWYEANRAADDINSTPSFVIDGEKYSNMNYADFAQLLDDKLAAADG